MEFRRQLRVRAIRALAVTAPLFTAIFGVPMLFTPTPANAVQSVPYLINFQGRLTDNSGNVLTDGSYNVKFRLWDSSSSGSNLWEADRVYGASDHRVTVQNGLFNIQFGDTAKGDPALSPSLFNNQTYPTLYLEVEMPTPVTATCASNGCATWTEGAMTPRQPLASAGYAFNSDTLDGLDSGAFVQLGASQTGNITISGALQSATAAFTGANSLTLGTAGPSGNTGAVIFKDSSNSNTVTLQAGTTSGNYTLTLPTAQASGTQFLQNNGSGVLSWASGSGCTDCVLNDASATDSTQTIAPTTDVTSLTIRQSSAGSPTKNIFAVTNSGGSTAYVKVDQNAAITVAAATTLSLSSGGSSDLSLSSGSGTINLTASTLKRTASGTTTLDFNDSSNTTLAVTNSGTGVANLTVDGGVSIGSGQTYKVNGTQISSADLSNNSDLAKLSATSQTFTGQNTFSRNGTGTGDYSVGVTGTPVADATSQLLRLGGANIASGSSSGTYIGANPTSFSGDFENFQVNGVTMLKHTALGDQTTGFTQLDGSSTTNGTGNAKTAMVLTSVTNFDVGNYIRLQNGTACDGTATTCYAKITAVNSGTNTLTITPALTWATGKTVDEWHVPEVGGTDLAQTLTNRYGRGYFIAGVATGNGTTYYNEDGIDSSLSTFNILSSATTINIGGASTTVALPGSLTVAGQSVVNSSGQINGAQLQANSVANGALASSSLTVTAGSGLVTGGSVSLGGSVTLDVGAGTGITVNANDIAVDYGSSAGTAVQGNTTLVCPSGSGNLTGTGNSITLGSGGTCNALDTITNPSFSGLLTASKSGANALLVSGTPLAGASGATSSLLQFGANAIASGNNTATTGGTWLGLNAASSGAGSTADFINFQNNGAYKLKVSAGGLLDAVGGVSINGTSVISSSALLQSAALSGTYSNALTLSSASNAFTGNGSALTSLDATHLVQGSGAVALQSATGANNVTIDSGSTGSVLIGGDTSNAKTISIGPTATSTSTTTLNFGINTAGTQDINLGSTGSGNAATGTTVNIQGGTTANIAVTIGTNGAGGITIDSGTTGAINIGTGAAAKTIVVGSNNTTSKLTLTAGNLTTTNNQAGIIIGNGYSTSATNLVPLTLSSDSDLSADETNTCSATVNQGALYYNSNSSSNAIRACINGGWEDLISTAGLGIMLFGVVADSGNNPGDLPALVTSGITGPCKVSWLSDTQVRVAPCVAYSGGRKVIVAQTDLTLTTTTTSLYESVCLTGTNSQPAIVGPANSQASATIFPNFSANNPVVCLATLVNGTGGGSSSGHFSVTGGTAGTIYDVRAFTQTVKEFATSAAAMGLGYIAQASGSGITTATATTGTGGQRGIVVATNGATAAGNNPNVIIATHGPGYVVATAGTAGQNVVAGNGKASFALTSTTTTFIPYAYLGVSRTTFASGCTSAATCLTSLYVDLDIR